MYQHGTVHTDRVTQIAQGNIAQGKPGPEVKGPDKGLARGAQMSRGAVLHGPQSWFTHLYPTIP